MATVTVTQSVDADPAHLWALLTNLPARRWWLTAIDEIEVLTGGPFRVGTAWREIRTMADGERVSEDFQVSSCEPGHCFVVSSPGAGADYQLTYRLTPIHTGRHQGGTEVTIEQEGHARGPAGKVLELVLGGLAARTAEGALWQELTDLTQATTVSPPPAAPAAGPAGPAAT